MSCERDRLRRQIADMQAKLQKQKNEVGRLTRRATVAAGEDARGVVSKPIMSGDDTGR